MDRHKSVGKKSMHPPPPPLTSEGGIKNRSSYCLQRTQDKTIVLIKQVPFLIIAIPLLFVSFLETCNIYYNIG